MQKMFLGPRRVFLDPFWPLGDSESKILSNFLGPKTSFVVEISDHRAVSGGPTEISDTFFESPTLGLYRPLISFGTLQ